MKPMLVKRALERDDGALWRACHVCGGLAPLTPDLEVCDRCAEVIPADTAAFLYDPHHRTANDVRGRS
ncbi:hypothetical protein [Planosporangium mesophilum]|uniref:Uncharacterized protein n=1 Tax=Planosporangium mesophilum TaxID=689768 RepID=A0A8J3THP1_9ACTN|nr:hypothetical protein [Planosporangium mesophilum]NJC83681.1 hypothetical protein [Planosporangium mesophilum]GII25347.1 hypothetical protein Pme01_49440 [Planosporangium mesophilum]